jgi:hypothetical protein
LLELIEADTDQIMSVFQDRNVGEGKAEALEALEVPDQELFDLMQARRRGLLEVSVPSCAFFSSFSTTCSCCLPVCCCCCHYAVVPEGDVRLSRRRPARSASKFPIITRLS